MHKDDYMTPIERANAMFSGKSYDRLPIMPFIVSSAGQFAGLTHKEKRSCPQNHAKAQICAYKKLDHDALTVEFGLLGIGRSFGTILTDPEDSAPAIFKHFLDDLDDLDNKLDFDMISRKNSPWLNLNYEAFQII